MAASREHTKNEYRFFSKRALYSQDYSAHYDIDLWGCMSSAKPLSKIRPNNLSRDIIKERCDNILIHVNLDAFFYHIADDSCFEANTKWKMYIYMRKCLLDYKAGLPHEELTLLLKFLESNIKDKKWFSNRLIDKAEKEKEEEDLWGSGHHEWLERCLIIDVLKRCAGMVDGVEDTKDGGCIWGDIDWLYLQAICRSRTKFIFYANEINSIESGHCGAIKNDIDKHGFVTKNSAAFDKKLIEAFVESKRIIHFINRIIRLFENLLVDPSVKIHPSIKKHFLSDGTETDDDIKLEEYRVKKFLPYNQEVVEAMFHGLYTFVSQHGADDSDNEKQDSSDSEEQDETLELALNVTNRRR